MRNAKRRRDDKRGKKRKEEKVRAVSGGRRGKTRMKGREARLENLYRDRRLDRTAFSPEKALSLVQKSLSVLQPAK